MCFPMYSPIVLRNNEVLATNILLGHTNIFAIIQRIDDRMPLNDNCWFPEWNWVKRFDAQAYAWQESQKLQSITPPDWVKESTLKELDALIEKHFPTWQKLYEAFRRTDNLLPRNKDFPPDEINPRSVLLSNAKELLPNSHIIWNEDNRPTGSDSTINAVWDHLEKLGKNSDNLIPVWRD